MSVEEDGPKGFTEGHKRYGTPLQNQAIDALLKHGGNITHAAAEVGITRASFRSRLAKVERNAALAGYSPEHHYTKPQPPGFSVRGVSSLYRRGESEPLIQWVKSKSSDEDRLTALREAFEEMDVSFAGRAKLIAAPKVAMKDLLAVYPMGDPHIGMLSWHLETGEDFDLKIARAHLVEAMTELVTMAPPAEQALIINLGDFFHSDNPSNRTARSGHALDVDSRWARCVRVGIDAMCACIDLALQKHKTVRVINEIGNHDDNTAVMLSLCLAAFYSNEPRVEIDTSPSTFHYVRFGVNLLGVTHGHQCKADKLGAVMSVDRKQDWGETKFRKWYTGHVHHDSLKEYPGCDVETFRTLAARDAWHHSSGYRSNRDMKCDVWHREKGLKMRHIVSVDELERKLSA